MIRFALLLLISLAVSSHAVAAVKWNNSGGSSSGKASPENYWKQAEKAKSCNGPEFEYIEDAVLVDEISVPPSFYEGIDRPLGKKASKKCKFNFATELVPEPLIDAKISSEYGGYDHKRFEKYYDFLNTNIGLNRLEPNSKAADRLQIFLITWANSNALSKNIKFKLMKEFRLDFHIQQMIPPLIIAYADVSQSMNASDRTKVGEWINRLVEQSQNSFFSSRQDNKAYLRHLIALLWGIVIENEKLISQARTGYQNAILDMRPDGTFPKEVSRGGTGIKYQNRAVNVLTTMAGFSTLIGENWIEYEVDGRSIKNAVNWINEASQNPLMNKIYARECKGGSDGTIDKPIMNYLDILRTGSTDLAWVDLYFGLTGEKPEYISKHIRNYKGYWSLGYGPQACIILD